MRWIKHLCSAGLLTIGGDTSDEVLEMGVESRERQKEGERGRHFPSPWEIGGSGRQTTNRQRNLHGLAFWGREGVREDKVT